MSRRALMVAALLVATAGCKNVGKCKNGTLLLTLKLQGTAANADQLVVNVSVGGGPNTPTMLNHKAGQNGTIEIDFSTYPAGQPIKIDVSAWTQGVQVADNSTNVDSLPAGCGTAALTVPGGTVADNDAGNSDGGGSDGAITPVCRNQMLDVGETDVDCGGPCPPCANGKNCAVNGDCQSQICNLTSKTCAGSDCSDGIRDDAETDVDCGGGTCVGCVTGQSCMAGTDCSNHLCNAGKMLCVASTCDDGSLDGTETDVDCGGSCNNKCKQGQSCLSNPDCASPGACDATHHCVAAQCTNGSKDAANPSATPPIAAETDIDCGGTVCAPCILGKMCLVAGDCTSGFCNAMTHVCVADQCHDGAKDGAESDVDCGGGVCGKCSNGQMCSGPSDCGTAGAECDGAHLCCTPVCSGKVCGSDGCGGSCGSCINATLPMCNGSGTACVCTATSCTGGLSCDGSGGCSCPTGTTENCFDGVDNNCDGLVDCQDSQCGAGVAVCIPTAPAGFNYGTVAAGGSCPGSSVTFYTSASSSSTSCTGCGGCTAFGSCTWTVKSDTAGGTGTCNTTGQGTAGTSTTVVATVTANTTSPNGTACVGVTFVDHQVTASVAASSSCTSGGTPSKPGLNTTNDSFCVNSQVGGGCGAGHVCVPAGYRCVEGTGSCSGTPTTYYTGIDDSGRSCTACSGCTVQTAGSCSGSGNSGLNVLLSCGGGGNTVLSGNTCLGNPYTAVSAYMFSGGMPTCGGSSSSTVTGSPALAGPVSVCCY